MNYNRLTFYLIAASLVVVAVSGALEPRAYAFVQEISNKNLSFLALVAEIKVVMAGLSKLSVPFLNGHSDAVSTTLDKAQTYLLFTSSISLLQLMILGVTKSVWVKMALVLLFAFSILNQFRGISTKLLVLGLALNPGLAFFSLGVQQLSRVAAIDYGGKYLQTLQDKVVAVKEEKSQLMEQHARFEAQVKNGQEHLGLFRKLKEDVSYDFKRAGEGIKGDFANIRLLVHQGGHEISSKLFVFGTMVLFSLLLMPLGYVLVLYTMFRTLFHLGSGEMAQVEKGLGIVGFIRVLKEGIHAGQVEVQRVRTEIGKELSFAKSSAEQLGNEISGSARAVEQNVLLAGEKATRGIDGKVQEIKNLAGEASRRVEQEFGQVESTVQQAGQDVAAKAKGTLSGVEEKSDLLIGKGKTALENLEEAPEKLEKHVVSSMEEKAAHLKSEAQSEIDQVESGVADSAEGLATNVASKAKQVKRDISQIVPSKKVK